MYELTFFDMALPGGEPEMVTCYVDDIEKFEEDYRKLEKEEKRIQDFMLARSASLQTEEAETSCIVLEDEDTEILKEMRTEIKEGSVIVNAGTAYPKEFRVKQLEITTRYVKWKEWYVCMISYRMQGIAECKIEDGTWLNYKRVKVGAHPFLKYQKDENLPENFISTEFEDFAGEYAESTVWYPLGYEETYEELQMWYGTDKPLISYEEVEWMLSDFI